MIVLQETQRTCILEQIWQWVHIGLMYRCRFPAEKPVKIHRMNEKPIVEMKHNSGHLTTRFQTFGMNHSSGNLTNRFLTFGRYGNSIVFGWRHAGIFLRWMFRLNFTGYIYRSEKPRRVLGTSPRRCILWEKDVCLHGEILLSCCSIEKYVVKKEPPKRLAIRTRRMNSFITIE